MQKHLDKCLVVAKNKFERKNFCFIRKAFYVCQCPASIAVLTFAGKVKFAEEIMFTLD